jgi:hypothetical protein
MRVHHRLGCAATHVGFPDKTEDVVFEGIFPANGKEMDLLRSQAKTKNLNPMDFTFDSSMVENTVNGKFTNFNFKPKNEFQERSGHHYVPTDSEATEISKKNVARPSAYKFDPKPVRSGPNMLNLKIVVEVTRTEWELYHSEIHKGGKGFNPRAGTRPWFGDTE